MLPPLHVQRYAMQNPQVAHKSIWGRVHKVGKVWDMNTSLSYTLGLLVLPLPCSFYSGWGPHALLRSS